MLTCLVNLFLLERMNLFFKIIRGECYCGNSYGSQYAETNCGMPCTGNAKEICGGLNANSIYLARRKIKLKFILFSLFNFKVKFILTIYRHSTR